HRSPERTTAAFSAMRASDSHRVWPVFASSAKYCPLFLAEKPKRLVPIVTPVLMSIVTSLLTHTSSVDHWPDLLNTRKPVTGMPRPDTITIWLWMIGVTALRVARTE